MTDAIADSAPNADIEIGAGNALIKLIDSPSHRDLIEPALGPPWRTLMFNHKLWTDTKRTGLVYFTVGMLICVWVTVWYFAFARTGEKPLTNDTWFWLTGFFMTGLTLMLIGGVQGVIHRSAQKAEMQLSAKSAEGLAQNAAPAILPGMAPPAPVMMAPPVPGPGMPIPTVVTGVPVVAPAPGTPIGAGA